MSAAKNLPLLPLTDTVVLPGMVVPIELADAETRAALDAARSAADNTLLVVPRVDGQHAAIGTVAHVEQVGRLPGGEHAAVLRGMVRARIGAGVSGPGAALWVSATEVEDPPADERTRDLATEYRSLLTSILQQRNAWQVIDMVKQVTDPGMLADTAGWAPYLDTAQKTRLLTG